MGRRFFIVIVYRWEIVVGKVVVIVVGGFRF